MAARSADAAARPVHPELVLTRAFAAPRAQVFAEWTDTAQLAR